MAQRGNGYVEKGNDAYRNGDYKQATLEYQKALEKDPTNTAAKFNLGNALQRQKDVENAIKQYDNLLSNQHEPLLRAKIYYNKGVALLRQDDAEDAIDAFKRALSLTPDDNDIRENLQKALNEKKQKQQQQAQPQNKQQQPKNQPKPPQKQPNKQMMEQKFNELENQEKQLQKQLQKKPVEGQPEKDW